MKNDVNRVRREREAAAGTLEGFYNGTVTGYLKGNELFEVSIALEGKAIDIYCAYAGGIVSSLLGFSMNFAPTPGTEVTVIVTKELKGYILGCCPGSTFINNKGVTRRVTTGGSGEHQSAQYAHQNFFQQAFKGMIGGELQNDMSQEYRNEGMPAGDTVEGEVDLTNAMGVGLAMMRHFASLKAGDLAKVEAFLIDDMVRIVSGTFKQFSSFGDYAIYNDGGRLNVRWDGTASDWEAQGKAEPNAQRAEMAEDIVNPEQEKFTNEARWRFSNFVGFLGDFINLFVTDQLKVTANSAVRSGKGRVHLNEDGSLLVQTVNEIVLERVCRIPVPIEEKTPEDPEGDGHESNGNLPMPEDDEPIKCWDWDKSGGVDKSFWCVFQLRDYARWFSNYYSKARFHQLKQDWSVPSEAETPEPNRVDSEEYDKRDANQGIPEGPSTKANVYATVRIARDGSIIVLDGYSNSITMSRNGTSVSSATNLNLEAAGSINMIAGRDINANARNSIDVCGLNGGLTLRGDKWIQMGTEGGILLEAKAAPSGGNDANSHQLGQTDPRRIPGVFIKAPNGNLGLFSGAQTKIVSEGLQLLDAPQLLLDGQAVAIRDNLVVTSGATLVKGILWSDMSVTQDLYSGNLVEGIFGAPTHMLGTLLDADNPILGPTNTGVFEELDIPAIRQTIGAWGKTKFHHRTSEEYGTLSKDAAGSSAIYETLTQQNLRLHAYNHGLKEGDSYSIFDLPTDIQKEGGGNAWPGDAPQHYVCNPSGWLSHEPSSDVAWQNHGNGLTLQGMQLRHLNE